MRFIILFCLFFVSIFAYDSYEEKIIKVETIGQKKFAYIKNNNKISKIGSSGVVYHNFKNSSSIIASAVLVSKDKNMIKFELINNNILMQNNLPNIKQEAQIGDSIFVNFSYDRALIIAPNQYIYDYIKNKFPKLYFLSPDVFGAHLISISKKGPNKADFKKICSNNALGLIIFALKEKAVVVDCNSFMIIDNFKIPKIQDKDTQKPFYSRIQHYRKDFLDSRSREVKDYYKFYNNLLIGKKGIN